MNWLSVTILELGVGDQPVGGSRRAGRVHDLSSPLSLSIKYRTVSLSD